MNDNISDGEIIIDVSESELKEATKEDLEVVLNPSKPSNLIEKTASLWKYNPIPSDEPEPFEEYISSHYENDSVSVTGARVRGKKHKHDGTNCDDWFEFDTSDDWIIAAVSDGAGSKKFSRIGAMESCKAAVSFIKEKLAEVPKEMVLKLSLPLGKSEFMESCGYFASIIQDAVIYASDAVKDAFESRKSKFEYLRIIDRDMELKDFSGTLLLSMMIPLKIENETEYFVLTCQIGDGMICSVDRSAEYDKALRLLGEPDSGAYSGETDFLTSEKMQQKERLMSKTKVMRGKTSVIMLMSDGVADDYFPNQPELLRLVMDLELNGVIKVSDGNEDDIVLDDIPEPLSYPWVNDNEKLIPIQYSKNIFEKTECSISDMWNNKSLIKKASLESYNIELPEEKKDRLLRWLDNYSERGSFDDRTLLIIETK